MKSRTKLRISAPVFGVNARASAEPITIPPNIERIVTVVCFIVVVLLFKYFTPQPYKTHAKKRGEPTFSTLLIHFIAVCVYQVIG